MISLGLPWVTKTKNSKNVKIPLFVLKITVRFPPQVVMKLAKVVRLKRVIPPIAGYAIGSSQGLKGPFDGPEVKDEINAPTMPP